MTQRLFARRSKNSNVLSSVRIILSTTCQYDKCHALLHKYFKCDSADKKNLVLGDFNSVMLNDILVRLLQSQVWWLRIVISVAHSTGDDSGDALYQTFSVVELPPEHVSNAKPKY